MSSYEISLRNELKRRDEKLAGRLPTIEEIAEKILVYTQSKFPYYTPHGFTHSRNVEECLNWIIPDNIKEKLHPYEIFFLILSSWFHDWGMVASEEEDPEEVRIKHHIRTEEKIQKYYDKIHISHQEAIILGKICRGHRIEDLKTQYYDPCAFSSGIMIDVRFLAALLRIADEFDITANRVPEVIFYELNPSKKAKEEFEKHFNIIGVSYASNQRYKIIISAIARDPKAAQTIEKLGEKIQNVINDVKTILALKGLEIDIIDLNLTTQGFIYRPIGFEIDKIKIVNLLIGEHLYESKDVAIREIIQNSIDACNLRKEIEPNVDFKINLRKLNKYTLEFEDNGIGMDYLTAKKFLSIIGASYYTSEEFKEFIKDKKFDPIARFGIGIISCFLISNRIVIETKKQDFEPCKFTINSSDQTWKYEKGTLKEVGTKIILELNEYGKSINIKETLKKYFISPEIPIYFQLDNKTNILEEVWDLKELSLRYIPEIEERARDIFGEDIKIYNILDFETEDFKLLFGFNNIGSQKQLLLFNHGIYINNLQIKGLSYMITICIDIKKKLLDLQLSRENIVKNKKWSLFIHNIFKNIFKKLNLFYIPNNKNMYIEILRKMIEARFLLARPKITFKYGNINDVFNVTPFLGCFINNTLFPITTNRELQFQKFNSIYKFKSINFYIVSSNNPLKEIELVLKHIKNKDLTIFNPYDMPDININDEFTENLLIALLKSKGIEVNKLNILNILLKNCTPINLNLKNKIPSNIIPAKFPNKWKPLVVISKKPIISMSKYSLGSSYWGNIILFESLLGDEKSYELLKEISRSKRFLDVVKLKSEPIVYVDAEDEFLKNIFKFLEKNKIDESLSQILNRYFKYISYLPLVICNIISSLTFLEVLDKLEERISNLFGFKRPRPISQRIGTIGKIYFEYLDGASQTLFEVERVDE